VLAHAQDGIKKIYNLYDYLDEKRSALELWERHLQEIVEPRTPPGKIIPLPLRQAS
jgi:hypothetical protein